MRFYLTISVLLLGLAFPVSASKTPPTRQLFNGDGRLVLENIHSGTSATIQYRDEDIYVDAGFRALSALLPCRLTQQETEFPPELLEVLDQIQEHFGDKPIQVISGYRSEELNAQLRRQKRGVARQSYHIRGKAMDIRIPGVATREIRDYALSLEAGGVGHYPGRGFVHVDVGPIRRW